MVMSMEQFLATAREQIAEHGAMIQYVFPTADDADRYCFGYTVGLAKPNAYGLARHPELIVVGLPDFIVNQMLNLLVERILDNGEVFVHGQEDWKLIGRDDFSIKFLDVTRENSETKLTLANRFYAGDLVAGYVPALQVVFPDDDGRWPWQPGSELHKTPILGPLP